VTAGTLYKEHRFAGPERLDLLESALLGIMKDSGWQLEAWAVFSNHYHFVVRAEPAAWFERTATRAQVGTIYGFKIDRLNVQDAFQPV